MTQLFSFEQSNIARGQVYENSKLAGKNHICKGDLSSGQFRIFVHLTPDFEKLSSDPFSKKDCASAAPSEYVDGNWTSADDIYGYRARGR